MSAEWEPQRTSVATRRFKVWFGGIFLTIGLLALLVAAIVYLVLSQVLEMGALIWAFIGAPLGLGVSFSALGGTFIWLGLRQARKEQRLRQFGTTIEGTVVAIEPTGTRVNRRVLWHVRYTYQDMNGATHDGESGYLSADEAQSYVIGDTVLVRYDPASPATSAWVGREESTEQA
jgi:hypothetical protein